MTAKALLLSLKPRYADAILSGTKRYELRRVRPRLDPDDLVLLYVTSPRSRIEGVFEVAGVLAAPPPTLWGMVADGAGIERRTFDSYFEGRNMAYAIEVKRVWSLLKPVPLTDLRSEAIAPPQGYHYLSPEQALAIIEA